MKKDFITITPESGKGDGEILLTIDRNTGEARETTIIVTTPEGLKRTITVRQEEFTRALLNTALKILSDTDIDGLSVNLQLIDDDGTGPDAFVDWTGNLKAGEAADYANQLDTDMLNGYPTLALNMTGKPSDTTIKLELMADGVPVFSIDSYGNGETGFAEDQPFDTPVTLSKGSTVNLTGQLTFSKLMSALAKTTFECLNDGNLGDVEFTASFMLLDGDGKVICPLLDGFGTTLPTNYGSYSDMLKAAFQLPSASVTARMLGYEITKTENTTVYFMLGDRNTGGTLAQQDGLGKGLAALSGTVDLGTPLAVNGGDTLEFQLNLHFTPYEVQQGTAKLDMVLYAMNQTSADFRFRAVVKAAFDGASTASNSMSFEDQLQGNYGDSTMDNATTLNLTSAEAKLTKLTFTVQKPKAAKAAIAVYDYATGNVLYDGEDLGEGKQLFPVQATLDAQPTVAAGGGMKLRVHMFFYE